MTSSRRLLPANRWTTCIAAFTAAYLAVLPPPLHAQDTTPPSVPSGLEVPAGHELFLVGHAVGTQNYMCVSVPEPSRSSSPFPTPPPSARAFVWAFFGPQATVFDDHDAQHSTHFLSSNPAEGGVARPTWQDSGDTSAVWAMPEASSSDPGFVEPGAIPWLRLRVTGADTGPTGGSRLTETTYIQRVNTSGGQAPATGCDDDSDVGHKALVPYTADYLFYKPTAQP